MGADVSVHESLEGSMRVALGGQGAHTSLNVAAPLTVTRSELSVTGERDKAGGVGSPLKGVSVGNAEVLVRNARRVEDLARVQTEVAGKLPLALSAQEARRGAARCLCQLPVGQVQAVVTQMVQIADSDADSVMRELALRALAVYARAAGKYWGDRCVDLDTVLGVVSKGVDDSNQGVCLAALEVLPRVLSGRAKPDARAKVPAPVRKTLVALLTKILFERRFLSTALARTLTPRASGRPATCVPEPEPVYMPVQEERVLICGAGSLRPRTRIR